MRYSPAVYEHKAALIHRSVREVAGNPGLLLAALRAEIDCYKADLITVGVDVYNLEVEALGMELRENSPEACPEPAGPLWSLETLPEEPVVPDFSSCRRSVMMTDVAATLRRDAPGVGVRVAVTGPATLAAVLVGMEDFAVGLALGEPEAERLLEFTTRVVAARLRLILEAGAEAVLFDSMAAPPLLGPELYREAVLPRHRRLMEQLIAGGQRERELVIGGDPTPIAGLLKQTGANLLLCDYAADAEQFAAELGDQKGISVRRNVSPASLVSESERSEAARRMRRDLEYFAEPVVGSGILPYRFDPACWEDFRRMVSC